MKWIIVRKFAPYFNANLQGETIQGQQESYGATHFTRKIGIYDVVKDRTVKWKCPDCGGEWDRK
ncbi:hypothetical protein [Neobacillus sp. PS3-40]|uniref:hypothetical protein n=1 Tax=Neobacillus sp. PS3-40 TaxID=3070679 RepID=UPI0027E1F6BA|nr:hypothetical protein [Neobacillus sp. PS3-40]WML44577.1 hypothetical protein RCG20_01290 [Neobacillus sp. PS3-40]